MRMRSTHRLVVAGVAAVLALTGCEAQAGADKAGGETVVLHFGTIDVINPNGQYFGSQEFVDAIEEVSEGRLQVEMTTSYGDGAADAETKLVEAIASGELDGGMPSVRAFARAGIPSLQVLEAPMTITSFAAQKALVSGPIADELLAALEGTGVVGLGLAVGPLRRPFAAEAPLLDPGDWEGTPFRVYNSPTQTDAVLALGGEPVDLGFGWIDAVRDGTLRGAEYDIPQYRGNGYTTEAGYVTGNVVLWPKPVVLAISQERFDSLTEEQRTWVREAAARAVQASVEATYDETTPAQQLCDQGVLFVDASADQIAALHERFAPVTDQLAAEPTTGALLADIQALAAQYPDPDVPDVASDCRTDPATAADDDLGAVPDEAAALPSGLYRAEIGADDVAGAGMNNVPGWSGIWTLEIEDGTYAMRCRPIEEPGHDCGNIPYGDEVPFDTVLDAGFVRGTGNAVYFVYDAALHSQFIGCEPDCFPVPTYRLTWELDGSSLRFSDLVGVTENEKTIKPWEKIG